MCQHTHQSLGKREAVLILAILLLHDLLGGQARILQCLHVRSVREQAQSLVLELFAQLNEYV